MDGLIRRDSTRSLFLVDGETVLKRRNYGVFTSYGMGFYPARENELLIPREFC